MPPGREVILRGEGAWHNKLACVLAQSFPTLCDPMDRNPPGSSVHGILQASVLEWIAISSSNNKLGWSANSCLQMGPCTCMVVPS